MTSADERRQMPWERRLRCDAVSRETGACRIPSAGWPADSGCPPPGLVRVHLAYNPTVRSMRPSHAGGPAWTFEREGRCWLGPYRDRDRGQPETARYRRRQGSLHRGRAAVGAASERLASGEPSTPLCAHVQPWATRTHPHHRIGGGSNASARERRVPCDGNPAASPGASGPRGADRLFVTQPLAPYDAHSVRTRAP